MNSGCGNTLSKVLGFPIRKSPDQSLVAGSPRHIAGSHVLHRLLMPRHPPYALKNLNTQRRSRSPKNDDHKIKDARVHCTILKKQATTKPHKPETRKADLAPHL